MRHRLFARNCLVTVALVVTLSACTPIPIYKPPSDDVDRAHIKIDFQDQSLLFGVAMLYRVVNPIVCSQPMKVERMLIINKGNPLIKDLNPTGAEIASGKRMTFTLMGLHDGLASCGRAFSFVPEAGKQYALRASNDAVPYSSSKPCNLDLLQYTSSDGAAADVPSFQFEACLQK